MEELPTGAIVGYGNLVECHLIDEAFLEGLTETERMLGDFAPGRYAWELADVEELETPIPARGGQRLWNWEPDNDHPAGWQPEGDDPDPDAEPDATEEPAELPDETDEPPEIPNDPRLKALSLREDTFSKIVDQFDKVMANTFRNMEDKAANEAEITLKLKITLSESVTRDLDIVAYEAEREIIVPEFEHKISSVMSIRDSCSGKLSGEYELVWDRHNRRYAMRKIEHGQTSLYDQPAEPSMTTTVDGQANVVAIDFANSSEEESPEELDDEVAGIMPERYGVGGSRGGCRMQQRRG